jgi:mono/diheme cytochrome c family protein
MTFKRVVNVIEILTLVAAIAFVVALFANEPGGGSGATAKSGPGYDVYLANCARCHGQDGQGGVGPKLAGGAVVRAFPDSADQIRLVEDGRGSMPAFEGKLSQAQIDDVVAYTRTELK